MTVNKEEIKKSRMYARQQLIDGWDQEIVSKGCVMIVGVGALGCEIAKDFALMGIGKIVLVDLDTIETSNLSRQMLFKPGDEGRPKAEVAAERLKDMNPFLKIDFYFEKLQKLAMSVYEECDVVIAALDNFNANSRSQAWHRFSAPAHTPMVGSGCTSPCRRHPNRSTICFLCANR